MKGLLKFIKKTYGNILRSIAFYPVLISFAFFILAITGLSVEHGEVIMAIKKKIPYLLIQDYETARSILSTLIGGILSLTVFSFSMVMVVLSQASANFSPRLLPGLISNKKNQIILGVYIGTLSYSIIILISLGAYGVDSNSLGLSTMFAALFGLVCITLFVYFIHSISRAIQIHNIIDRIYKRSKQFLDKTLNDQSNNKVALQNFDTQDWAEILSETSGYFRGFDTDLLVNSLKNKDNAIAIIPYKNQHLWEGMPVLKVREPITEAEQKNLIFCLDISSDRHESDKGIGGMIKLMEITVKAMSPGINDPGTAIDAINKLGELLGKFMQFPNSTSATLEDGKCIINRNNISATELMRIIVQPIRLYAKHDSTVVFDLIGALHYVRNLPNVSQGNKQVVTEALRDLRNDIEQSIPHTSDKERILKLFNHDPRTT